MKALSRITPLLVVLMTDGLALAADKTADKKGSPTAPKPGSVEDMSKPSTGCLTCLTQDTLPKQTSQGTGGEDPDKKKKPNVKAPNVAPVKTK
jgi:hypothetical protein